MTDDLISRQEALNALGKDPMGGLNYESILSSLPPAKQERKKGKWIYHPEIGWGDTWLCDQCGEKTTSTVMGKPRANYCPMCGADMRGKQDG